MMSSTAVASDTEIEAKTFGRERLSPGIYTIDLSAVADIPLKLNGESSTLFAAISKLQDSKIQEMPENSFGSDRYITNTGEVVLDGDWRVLFTIRTVADLMRRGINLRAVMWFYYDHDWSRDADESHHFFAVHGDSIVLESCHFNSEEPLVLKNEPEKEPIWHNHPYFEQALEHYWYRKFYTETVTGQLMVLRPDEPILYHYERPQTRDAVKDLELVTLIKMYRVLWVILPLLVAIAFPSSAMYMGIIAAVLLLDVMWRCWAMRNVGHSD
jgi:hypothetical protein